MKHQPDEVNKLHNRQKHLSELEYQIGEDRQFNQNPHQLLLTRTILIIVTQEVVIKN
jgi:hypothetical protein